MDRPFDISIVIPIHNEAAILESAVTGLLSDLEAWRPDLSFEVILAENGSRDETPRIALDLSDRFEPVRVITSPVPNYGAALRQGILSAKGRWILCDEIDLCDVDFYSRALPLLESGEADFVVGSKAMKGAKDERPFLRRAATLVINNLLRLLLGFHGTDTHGLKAFASDKVVPVVRACKVDRDLFASELVIRSERTKLRVREIPVQIHEKRAPSIRLLRRVPTVLSDLAKLYYAIKIKG